MIRNIGYVSHVEFVELHFKVALNDANGGDTDVLPDY